MALIERYFDNAATTPVDPRVVREMLPYYQEHFGNAHSIHSFAAAAMAAVDRARGQIAELIGAEDPAEIVFVSGASEGNNWLLRRFPDAAISPFEHSSLYEPARKASLEILQNDGWGLSPSLTNRQLVSVMLVNNETGTIFEPTLLRGGAQRLHTDATQAIGKINVNLSGVDFATFSGHKFYGPKGVGAVYIKGGQGIEPLLLGGDQENGLRAGTLNVPGIVGMGFAAAIAADHVEDDFQRANDLRSIVLDELTGTDDFEINGGPSYSPYILSVSFRGVEGETLVIEMDRRGFAVSSGAACSSRSTEPSHVLKAAGLANEWIRGAVRISFGRFNTRESAREMAQTLRKAVETIREVHHSA